MSEPTVFISGTAQIGSDVKFVGDGEIHISDYVTIESGAELHATGRGTIWIGSRSKIKSSCFLKCYSGNISIGHRTTIGEFAIVAGHGGVEIGDYCIVAPYVMINAASHILSGNEPYRFLGEATVGIKILDNVWLGARCTILDGVTVGHNVIVGAHSLVNRNLVDDSTVVGTPARPI